MKKLFTIPFRFYIFLLCGSLFTMAVSLHLVSAEEKKCFGQYGQEISCPIQNKAFTIEKFVQVGDTWQNNRSAVEPGNNVTYLIHIKNTGELSASLEVHDLFPINTKITKVSLKDGATIDFKKEDTKISWMTDLIKPGQSREYVLVAETNGNGVAQGTEKCGIENIAEIYYQDTLEGKDSAFICIKTGEVLGQLPETASIDWSKSWISFAVVLQLVGLVLLNITKFAKQS